MKTYEVTIRATVLKTYTVQAHDDNEALNTGHEIFSVETDEAPERYEQETVDVTEVTS
jgi:hypothetical protein